MRCRSLLAGVIAMTFATLGYSTLAADKPEKPKTAGTSARVINVRLGDCDGHLDLSITEYRVACNYLATMPFDTVIPVPQKAYVAPTLSINMDALRDMQKSGMLNAAGVRK